MVIDSGHHLNDFKWPMSSGHKLGGGLIDAKIFSF
jgi:hypothetical protein